MLTSAQVADRLGVSVWTVYRLVRDGHLHPIRLSARNFRFREAELARFLIDAEKAS